jgi:hypothetical protein
MNTNTSPTTLTCDQVTFNPNLVKLSTYHIPVRNGGHRARPVVAAAFIRNGELIEVYTFSNCLEADTYRRVTNSDMVGRMKASLEAGENVAQKFFSDDV